MNPSLWRFTKGDGDGFFGLFIDNLLQLLLILTLCPLVCGIPVEVVTTRLLPGAAFSILLGNAYYAWQAWRLAKAAGRDDVTALPYGINTVSLVAYVFFIMGPVYRQTQDATLAWQAGLFACFLSGVMETVGAFLGPALRRHAPRAALLSSLAGIAITFIAMGFVFQVFASPALGLLPLLLILVFYAGKVRLPMGLPGGLVAVIIGTGLAWLLRSWGLDSAQNGAAPVPSSSWGLHLPHWAGGDLWHFLATGQGWKYFAVIFPMGLFNVIGSLQCLESAAAAGDEYETRPSLLANGLGTLLAAVFGSPFPTTLYIGHPGWKDMGARWGYSTLNGLVITVLVLCGGVGAVLQVVPLEVTLGILLWIGLVITAQAFQASPREEALAVAVGLVPALASWALYLIETTLRVAGTSLEAQISHFGSQLYIQGVISLHQGFLLTSILYAAVVSFVIRRAYRTAAVWMLACAGFSAVGLIHAYTLTPNGVENRFGWWEAPEFALPYLAAAAVLWGLSLRGNASFGAGKV